MKILFRILSHTSPLGGLGGLFLFLFLLFSSPTLAQRLLRSEGGRIEVTSRLDSLVAPAAESLLMKYKAGVDSIMAPVLGRSEMAMAPGRPESLLGNLLCDILVDVSRQYGQRADLAVLNRGGLRSTLPEGDVTVGDIMEIAPFENHYTIVAMRGDLVEQLMGEIAKAGGECVSRDVRLTIEDCRVKSLTLRGRRINPNKIYRIATLDYLAEGNDGMTAFRRVPEKNIVRSKVLIRDLYMNYIRQQTKRGRSLTAKLDGRITITGEHAGTLPAPPVSAPPVTITVAHTNDTHSCVEPFNPNAADRDAADKGGYLRRTALVDSLRRADSSLVLVDAGDFSQGSPYYNLYRGDAETDLMNYMRYDAATIGNHEFDFGLDNLARLVRRMRFPVVCCNYDFTATPLAALVRPYTIIERHGLRIGLTGVGARLDGLVAAANCEGVAYREPLVADTIARRLKEEEGCDLVVLLSHIGVEEDERLIPQTHYIDAIVSAHSHTYFKTPRTRRNADGREVIYNQEGKNARYVGLLRFTFQP